MFVHYPSADLLFFIVPALSTGGMLRVGVVGHSFVRRLATYALETRSVNLDLDPECYAVTFFAKGRLTVPRLHEFTHAIVRENIDLVFLEIAANDITSETSVGELGDSVLAFAIFFTAMTDVRHVIISQMYFRDRAASVYPVVADFNDRVYAYNKYMHD